MTIRPETIAWFRSRDMDMTGLTQEECDTLIDYLESPPLNFDPQEKLQRIMRCMSRAIREESDPVYADAIWNAGFIVGNALNECKKSAA